MAFDGFTGISTDHFANRGISDSLWNDPRIFGRAAALLSLSTPDFLTPAFNAGAANFTSQTLEKSPLLVKLRPTSLDSSTAAMSSDGFNIFATNFCKPRSETSQLLVKMYDSSTVVMSPVVNFEEEVLVMDAVVIGNSAEKNHVRSRVSSASGSCPSGKNLYKTGMCRSWEDTGVCRYGSKCQFAHGKEELRNSRSCSATLALESEKSTVSTAGAGAFDISSKLQSPLPFSPAASNSISSAASLPSRRTSMNKLKEKAILLEQSWPTPVSGIRWVSFEWPATEEENAYFDQKLYGPSTHHRLPVFKEFCP